MSDTATDKPSSPQPLGLSLHDQLGPLPEPAFGWLSVCGDDGRWRESDAGERAFDAQQMHAYAERAVAAERERCAAVAESWATDETATTCANVAAAIRGPNV